MRIRVKMCCISNEQEVRDAVAAGADVLGFVSDTLGGLGILPIERIAVLRRQVPPGVGVWLLTGADTVEEVSAQIAAVQPDTVQLVRPLTAAQRAALRERHPTVGRVQVVHVIGPEALAEATAMTEVEALLLDSSDPAAGALGATGKTHDWQLSARIVASVSVPVWLAGGLKVRNVAEAILTVSPFGVDLCTGLRTDRVLDRQKSARFVEATLQREP